MDCVTFFASFAEVMMIDVPYANRCTSGTSTEVTSCLTDIVLWAPRNQLGITERGILFELRR